MTRKAIVITGNCAKH